MEVSSPSPSPAYIRLIQKQAARVSGMELGECFLRLIFLEQGKAGGIQKGPCGPCVLRAGDGRLCVIFPDGSLVG